MFYDKAKAGQDAAVALITSSLQQASKGSGTSSQHTREELSHHVLCVCVFVWGPKVGRRAAGCSLATHAAVAAAEKVWPDADCIVWIG